ncbi:MAG TPA: NAD(P)-binding domain-containing protein, partial [Clostridia bacterium]|nr:NAD(P)-binding domain-containing protein [Clostridia bacterium]
MKHGKIGFIGGGNMAGAIINGILNKNLYFPEQIYVSDVNGERLEYF